MDQLFHLTRFSIARKLFGQHFPSDRLRVVRDIFLFSCYTAPAYADVKKLKRSEIILGVDGEQ